ncbi:MAG: cell division protein FtsQ/DivIB [Candidatus Omnitrophota bacterium]
MSNKNKRQKKASPAVSLFKPLLIVLLLGFFCFVGVKKTFVWVKDSSYFRVRRITCSVPSRAKSLEKFLYLRNQSIFDVKLAGLQKQLEWLFPEVGQVRVFKRFPDEIRIVLQERSPYAVLALGVNHFVIDRQGFVISKDLAFQGAFPLIRGLHAPSGGISLGQRIVGEQLQIALNILDSFSQAKALRSFVIVKMDVGNLSRISLYLGDQLEVVVDQEDVQGKINTLGVILEKVKLDWERIRYIDLRFKEPVIKYDE